MICFYVCWLLDMLLLFGASDLTMLRVIVFYSLDQLVSEVKALLYVRTLKRLPRGVCPQNNLF